MNYASGLMFQSLLLNSSIKKSMLILMTSISLLFANFLPVNSVNDITTRENVLIIHSYNQGFSWTDELHRGITEKLSDKEYNIYTEYLDAYRVNPVDPNKIEIIKGYADKNISYIIVTDNAAFDLILSLKEQYFPDTPVLFAGVNGGIPEDMHFDDVKGILQNVSYSDFLFWLNKTMPDIKTLLVCGAKTDTTEGTYKQLMEAYNSLGKDNLNFKIQLIQIEDYTEQLSIINTYDKSKTAIYSAGSFGVLNHDQYTDMLSSNSDMPTFCGVSTSITNDVIGGYVVSPYEHGQILGDDILALSEGASIQSLSIISTPIQQIIFNYNGINKFHIEQSQLPENSVIINKPEDLFVLNLAQVIMIISIVAFLIVVISALLFIQAIRRKSSRELSRNYEMLVKSNHKITNLLDYNQLTGILNDTKFYALLESYFPRGKKFTLLNITIINLNKLTFTHGRDVYDSILTSISGFLRDITKENDLIGISRNNDFLIAAEGIVEEDSQLIRQIETFFQEPLISDLFSIILTYKIGIAYFPAQTDSYDKLSRYSRLAITPIIDNTMVNISVFNKYIMEMMEQENSIKNEIEEALMENEFIFYYQPKYAVDGITILGLEALIRWKYKDGTIKEPGYFIGIAEQSGQIINIGFYVIEEACKAIIKYDLIEKNIPIAINLSGRHFASKDILYKLTDATQRYHISPRMLELEITETTLITNKEFGAALLSELRELGFSITLDDFGTGYASINYIKDLPIDKLKIDQSFVRKLNDIKSRNLLKSMIKMAHEMSYEVTIEGIETQEQFEIIREFEPRELQGYLFKRPVPMEEIDFSENCKV